MKKITLLAVALGSALTVGAFAHGMNNQQNMPNQGMMNGGMMHGGMMHGGMMNGGMMNGGMMNGGMMNGGMMNGQGMNMGNCMGINSGMPMFSQLNLTSEQQHQLSILN